MFNIAVIKMNLIICTTPFHVLMSREIIRINSNEEYIGIMLAFNDNNKYIEYFNLLESICDKAYFIPLEKKRSSILSNINNINAIRKKIMPIRFDKVVLASIDSIYVSLLLHKLIFRAVETYDDGLANINTESSYFNFNYSLKLRLLIKLLNLKYTIKWFKKESSKHYTIYRNEENLFKNLCYIKLFEDEIADNSQVNKNDTLRIILGQPLNISQNKYNQIINNTIEKLDIDYYFPHPRENFVLQNVKYIYTDKIIEDYIIGLLNENSKLKVILFSYGSSASLNLSSIDRIESIIITDIINIPEGIKKIFINNGVKILSVNKKHKRNND